MKILVVDDDAELLDEVGASLRRLGHATVAAGGATEACAALENNGTFDLVLTDLRMPAGTGLEVLRTCIRKTSPRPAVLVMTGDAGAAEIDDAIGLGADVLLPKPFTRHQLSDAISLAMCTR